MSQFASLEIMEAEYMYTDGTFYSTPNSYK